jgi:hypothetical protein
MDVVLDTFDPSSTMKTNKLFSLRLKYLRLVKADDVDVGGHRWYFGCYIWADEKGDQRVFKS